MKRYIIRGKIEITYSWDIDQTVEVEDDEDGDDAVEAVIDDLSVHDSFDANIDTFGLNVDEVDGNAEDLARQRERDLALLMAWNNGAPIPA